MRAIGKYFGHMELWHENIFIKSDFFRSKWERKEIFDKWNTLYKFNNKKNIVVIVKPAPQLYNGFYLDLDTGIYYKSLALAAEGMRMSRTTLSEILKTKKSDRFRRVF